MSPAAAHRLAAYLLLAAAGLAVAACGGGELTEMTSGTQAAASTLLDDDGSPMPSEPSALPAGTMTTGLPRHATAAQAADLRRALGDRVRSVDVGCCGDRLVEDAIAAAAVPSHGVPLAVLLEGSDLPAQAAAAARLHAAGLERVWVVLP